MIINYTKDFPDSVRGATMRDGDSFIIAINDNKPGIVKRHALGHELAHIYLGHFTDTTSSRSHLEKEANKHAWEYYRGYRDGIIDTEKK